MNQIIVTGNTLTVSGRITRSDVGTLRDELLEALAAPAKPRVVRLAAVEAIDSAGIQLLCALLKGFPTLQVTEVPDVLRDALGRLGASTLFEGV